MKKLLTTPIIIIILFVLLGSGVGIASIFIGSSGGGTINLEKGLVGYWKLDNNAKDSTPYESNLTNTNGVTFTTDRKVQSSKAGQFVRTSSQYLTVPDNTILSAEDVDFTISGWVYADSLAGAAAFNDIFGKYNITGNQREYLVYYDGSAARFKLQISASGTSASTTTLAADNFGAPNTATWYFIIAWHDATANTVNLSINNGTADSVAHTTGVFNSTAAFQIGVQDGGASYWNGRIDDVRVYKKVLTSAEKTALYESYNPGISVSTLEKGLVGHWNMNGNAKDSTPYQNNGTILGSQLHTSANFASDPNGNEANATTGWTNTGNGVVTTSASQVYAGTYAIDFSGATGTGFILDSGAVAITAGKKYQLTIAVRVASGGSLAITVRDSTDASTIATLESGINNVSYILKTYYWTAQGNNERIAIRRDGGSFTGQYFDNVSVKEIFVAATTDRKSQSNKAYLFNGTSDYIKLGDVNDDIFTGADKKFSISAWIKPASVMIDNIFVAKAADGDCSENQRQFYFELRTDSKLQFFWDGALDGSSYRGTLGTTQITDTTKWYHVAMTYDGTLSADTRVSLYVDGTAESTSINFTLGSPTSIVDGTAHLGIGKKLTSSGTVCGPVNGFDGSIDDVRIYNRALSATEATALYNSYDPGISVSSLQKGLVGHWIASSTDTTSITRDQTPQGNNGTVTSATQTTDRKSQSNKAYLFNGTSSLISLGDVLDTTFTGSDKKFSISAWIKPAATMTNNVIVSKTADSNCTEDQRGFTFRLSTSSKLGFIWQGALTSSSYRGTLGTTQITDTSKWYHVVSTYDGTLGIDSRVALYVDGTAESTSIDLTSGTPSAIQNGTAHLGIGDQLSSSGSACGAFYFNGSLDDVRVYNRVLSATEVLALYNSY